MDNRKATAHPRHDVTFQRIRRAIAVIPIVVRPLLFLAIVPIALHLLLFRDAPAARPITAGDDPELPAEAELRRMITEHSDFRRKKRASCRIVTPDAPVCRALVDLGYADPQNFVLTPRGNNALGHDVTRYGESVTVSIARPQVRAIVKTTPPPQEEEHLRRTTRVDFTWAWEATNRVGDRLGIAHHHRDMRGSLYLVPSRRNKSWEVMGLQMRDTSPAYSD